MPTPSSSFAKLTDTSSVETSLFTKLLPDYLKDDEYRGLQSYLLNNSDAGSIIRHSGGVRKVRWGARSRGKSGGVRVI